MNIENQTFPIIILLHLIIGAICSVIIAAKALKLLYIYFNLLW